MQFIRRSLHYYNRNDRHDQGEHHYEHFHDHDEQEDHVTGSLGEVERDVINISQEEPYTSAPAMTKMTTSLITNLIRQYYIFLHKDQYCCKDQLWSIDYL